MKPLADCKLYAFVDTAYLHGRAPEVVAQQLCDGGADLIQLRAKTSSPAEIRRMAGAIAPVLRKANVGLVINDHLDIAREVGAEVCHLGQEDFFDVGFTHVAQLATGITPEEAELAAEMPPEPAGRDACATAVTQASLPAGSRSILAPCFQPDTQSGATSSQLKIGLSTHAPAQAERAVAAGADYVAIGPIYATGTKPTAKPVTLDYVRWAAANVKVPWFAIGGINLQTIDAVLEAGATRICVVSAILNAPDVTKACAEFRKKLG